MLDVVKMLERHVMLADLGVADPSEMPMEDALELIRLLWGVQE